MKFGERYKKVAPRQTSIIIKKGEALRDMLSSMKLSLPFPRLFFFNFVENRKRYLSVESVIAQAKSRPRVIARSISWYYLRWLAGQRSACPSRYLGSLSSLAHRSMARYARSSTRTIDVNRVTPRLQLGDMQLVSASDLGNDSKREVRQGVKEKRREMAQRGGRLDVFEACNRKVSSRETPPENNAYILIC